MGDSASLVYERIGVMKSKWYWAGFLLVIAVCFGFVPAHAKVIFSDNFNSGASGLWSNDVGNWTTSEGVYYAQNPGVDPITYTGLPFNLIDFTVEFDVNVRNGGIFLRSSYEGGVLSSVSLCMFDHSGSRTEGMYWHIINNRTSGTNLSGLNYVSIPGFAGTDHHLKIVVEGNTYAAYVDGILKTTLVTDAFYSGRVAFYDAYTYLNQPQKIDNFNLQGTTVPLPSAVILLGSGLVRLVIYRRRWGNTDN